MNRFNPASVTHSTTGNGQPDRNSSRIRLVELSNSSNSLAPSSPVTSTAAVSSVTHSRIPSSNAVVSEGIAHTTTFSTCSHKATIARSRN